MTKKTRVLGASLGAVAFSLFFVAGALAQAPTYAITLDKWASTAASTDGTPVVTSLPAGGGSVSYWYAVKNTGTGGGADLQVVSIVDDKCTPVAFDHSSDPGDDDQGGGDKLDVGDTWWFTCGPKALTATTTNTATASACKDNSKGECNNANHEATATDSATVTVSSTTATIDMTGTSAAMLALILLAIGGIGFLGTTNRLPKLPKFR